MLHIHFIMSPLSSPDKIVLTEYKLLLGHYPAENVRKRSYFVGAPPQRSGTVFSPAEIHHRPVSAGGEFWEFDPQHGRTIKSD